MIVYMLHLAMGLKPGDEALVPSHTAFPTMEPLIHCGATPVFIDIDDTYCMDADQIEAAITPRTVGIIPVHLTGIRPISTRFSPSPPGTNFGCWKIAPRRKGRNTTAGPSFPRIGGAFSFFPSKT